MADVPRICGNIYRRFKFIDYLCRFDINSCGVGLNLDSTVKATAPVSIIIVRCEDDIGILEQATEGHGVAHLASRAAWAPCGPPRIASANGALVLRCVRRLG